MLNVCQNLEKPWIYYSMSVCRYIINYLQVAKLQHLHTAELFKLQQELSSKVRGGWQKEGNQGLRPMESEGGCGCNTECAFSIFVLSFLKSSVCECRTDVWCRTAWLCFYVFLSECLTSSEPSMGLVSRACNWNTVSCSAAQWPH